MRNFTHVYSGWKDVIQPQIIERSGVVFVKKRSLYCVVVFVLAMLLPMTAWGAVKDTLMFRLNSEPVTLDPQNCNDIGVSQNPHYQLFDSLTRLETDGNLSMALAETITTSENGMVLSIKIREGVKFHNGDTMTTEDVEYSLNRAIESRFNTVMTSSFLKAVKVDDSIVELHLKYPYAPALQCLATIQTCVVPKAVVEANSDGFARDPVGTGCFKFVSWAPGNRIVLTRFDDYYRGPAKIKDLTYTIIPDHSTAFIALEKGEIDIMINPNISDRDAVMEHPDLVYHECEAASFMLFTFNNEVGRFADKRLRKAVSMVVDREALIIGKEGQAGLVEAALHPILPEYPKNFEPDPLDLAAAKQLVIDAGYPNGLTVKAPTIDAATYIIPTTQLQEMLRPIGITLEIEIMARGAWNQRVLGDTDYELCLWANPITVLDADFATYGPFHSSNRGGNGNFSNCNIPEVDRLVELGRVTPPGPERNEAYRQFCEIIKEEAVIVPFMSTRRELPARVNLKGIRVNPTMRYYVFDAYWE